MRIGIDATIVEGDRPTGMAFYAINLIRELAKLHDDIVVWTIRGELLDIPLEMKRSVLQPFAGRGALLPWVRAVWTQIWLPRLLQREGVDVLFSPIPEGILSPIVPQVLVVHDTVPLVCPEDAPFFRRWSFRWRVPVVLRTSSHVVAVSESTKGDIVAFYGIDEKKVSVVYEGYNNVHFGKITLEDTQRILDRYALDCKKYYLFLGNFTPRKNIHNLLSAFKLLVDRGVDMVLVLAGNRKVRQDYTRKVISLVEDLKLGPKLRLLDYVPFTDLPALYNGAKALVFPSYYEGFGLPAIEAMACGAPVIASRSSSLPEVCGDSALLVNEDSPESIASGMLELACNEGLCVDLARRGFERVKGFSWGNAASEVLSVLRSMH